jgi:serine/threonine protein phosphatase PrpC
MKMQKLKPIPVPFIQKPSTAAKTNNSNYNNKTKLKNSIPQQNKKSVTHDSVFNNTASRRSESDRVFSSISFRSMAGMSEGISKVNQDAYFIDTTIGYNPNMSLIGCFDGHGMEGHRCSNYLKQNLAKIFVSLYKNLGTKDNAQNDTSKDKIDSLVDNELQNNDINGSGDMV